MKAVKVADYYVVIVGTKPEPRANACLYGIIER